MLADLSGRAGRELLPVLRPPPEWPAAPPGGLLTAGLRARAQACPRPLVLFFDEIDALTGASLSSVLHQLRAGYADRPAAFPAAVVLCCMRDACAPVRPGAHVRQSPGCLYHLM